MKFGVDVGGGSDAKIDRIGATMRSSCELNVGWIDDGNLQPVRLDPVRKLTDPQQDVQRDRLGSLRLDALDAEVDQRQPVGLAGVSSALVTGVDITP